MWVIIQLKIWNDNGMSTGEKFPCIFYNWVGHWDELTSIK